MVELKASGPGTADAIYGVHARRAEDWRRPHLGASVIGHECNRHLWYHFRWAAKPSFMAPPNGRMLRLFERGKREEAWIIEDLRLAGIEVFDLDKGKQWRVVIDGGHFGGSVDGVVIGVPEAPKTPHVLEVKTSNKKKFAALLKKGVRLARPEHWAQMQVYMLGLKLKRALYVCVCKDDDEIYAERIELDKGEAEAIKNRAALVIYAQDPLARIGDAASFQCRFCDYKGTCHERGQPERNCRTCAFSSPREDGSWSCTFHKEALDLDTQKLGCDHHLFLPTMLDWLEVEDADETKHQIVYRDKESGDRVVDSMGALR